MSLNGITRFAPGQPVKPCLRMVARDKVRGMWPWEPSAKKVDREYRKLVAAWERNYGRPLTDADVWG